MINPVSNSFSAQGDPRVPNKDLSQTDFLKIMISQISNQNPFNAADSNQFMQNFMDMGNFQAIQDMAAQSEKVNSSQLQILANSLVGVNVTVAPDGALPVTGDVAKTRIADETVYLTIGEKEYPVGDVESIQRPPTQPQG